MQQDFSCFINLKDNIMLKSKILTDISASPATNQLVLKSLGLDHSGPIQYMVMKSEIDGEEVLCALAGGKIVGNDINLTPTGTGAYEVLDSLPGEDIQLYALSDDDEVMALQIPSIIEKQKTGSRLCFISDSLVERQHQIMKAFSLTIGSFAPTKASKAA